MAEPTRGPRTHIATDQPGPSASHAAAAATTTATDDAVRTLVGYGRCHVPAGSADADDGHARAIEALGHVVAVGGGVPRGAQLVAAGALLRRAEFVQ